MLARFTTVFVVLILCLLSLSVQASDQVDVFRACLQTLTDSCRLSAKNQTPTVNQGSSLDDFFDCRDAAVETCRVKAGFVASRIEESVNYPVYPKAPYPQAPLSSTPDPVAGVAKSQTPATPAAPSAKPAATVTPASTPSPAPVASTNCLDTDTAQSQVDADVAACNTLQTQAQQCCNDPASCSSGMSASDKTSMGQLAQQMNTSGSQPNAGLSGYCAQLQQASTNGGNVNNALGSICASNQSSCQSTCAQLAQKYQNLMNDPTCGSASVYQNGFQALTSSASACGGLQAQANQLSTQGVTSGGIQGQSSACNQMAAAMPGTSSAGGVASAASPGDPFGCSADPTSALCVSCASTPNSPKCKALAAAQGSNQMGKDGLLPADPNSPNNPNSFNVGNLPDSVGASGFVPSAASGATGKTQAQLVPNNSGGGIPGANGNPTGAMANLSNNSKSASPGLGEHNRADILQGLHGGNGFQGYGGGGSGFEDQAGRRLASFGAQAGTGKTPYAGWDLRRYLPGGDLDPNRGLAGMTRSSEINGKNVDMFRTISTKLEEKCKLGELFECR